MSGIVALVVKVVARDHTAYTRPLLGYSRNLEVSCQSLSALLLTFAKVIFLIRLIV